MDFLPFVGINILPEGEGRTRDFRDLLKNQATNPLSVLILRDNQFSAGGYQINCSATKD